MTGMLVSGGFDRKHDLALLTDGEISPAALIDGGVEQTSGQQS